MPGHIDVLDSRHVCGWALEADRKTPDRVIIYVDGEEIAQIRPTLFRADLRDAGLGDLKGRVVETAFSSSLRQGFSRCAYAAEATGVGLPQSAKRSFGASEVVSSADKGDHLVLTASVLAPPGAILAVVPSMHGYCRVLPGRSLHISRYSHSEETIGGSSGAQSLGCRQA
jgi:hypothetical protein